MSNSLAIAAVTATLRDLLLTVRQPLPGDPTPDPDLAETTITTKPPDKARESDGRNQLNVFLYQTLPDAAWRNQDLPAVRPGELGQPPLALRLHYLLTAYGRNNDDILAHRLLGRAMSVLHDRALLSPSEIQTALPGADLHRQVERVRITPLVLSPEDLSKLWTTFQTGYRVSAAYEASAVLIESTRPARVPLPVLRRGPADQGAIVQPDVLPPYPTLISVELPNKQPSARLGTALVDGDILTLVGHHLKAPGMSVRLSSPRLAAPVTLAPLSGATAERVRFQLPVDSGGSPVALPAGYYTVAVVTGSGGDERASNSLSFAIAPRITNISPNPTSVDGTGAASISFDVIPPAVPAQTVSLLLGDREVRSAPRSADAPSLTFDVLEAPIGSFYARLRVDGVDTLIVKDYTKEPPSFDPGQIVTINP